jgi:hypothetical protein
MLLGSEGSEVGGGFSLMMAPQLVGQFTDVVAAHLELRFVRQIGRVDDEQQQALA